MKSSTIRRSNLSKEKMAVIEALSKYRQESYDESPNVYVRPAKEQELDVLWQDFKVNQKQSGKSPNVYLATGFIAGALTMLIFTSLIGFTTGVNKGKVSEANKVNVPAAESVSSGKTAVHVPSASTTTASSQTFSGETQTYTVKSGDTIETIAVKFYGSYSPEKQAEIIRVNGMDSPNKLSIGQKLTIPME